MIRLAEENENIDIDIIDITKINQRIEKLCKTYSEIIDDELAKFNDFYNKHKQEWANTWKRDVSVTAYNTLTDEEKIDYIREHIDTEYVTTENQNFCCSAGYIRYYLLEPDVYNNLCNNDMFDDDIIIPEGRQVKHKLLHKQGCDFEHIVYKYSRIYSAKMLDYIHNIAIKFFNLVEDV